jgi:5-(carboxyamino)imidazole ribonucleotide mutase
MPPTAITPGALVAVVMGSTSDWSTMAKAVAVLEDFEVPHHIQVLSAHRMPDEMFHFAEAADGAGLRAIIAGAGGAAHLPGMLAAKTTVPVLGVPAPSRHLAGLDSLYSIVQMPAGIPVATFAIGEAGATNAALFAVAVLASDDARLAARLHEYRRARHDDAAGEHDRQLPFQFEPLLEHARHPAQRGPRRRQVRRVGHRHLTPSVVAELGRLQDRREPRARTDEIIGRFDDPQRTSGEPGIAEEALLAPAVLDDRDRRRCRAHDRALG